MNISNIKANVKLFVLQKRLAHHVQKKFPFYWPTKFFGGIEFFYIENHYTIVTIHTYRLIAALSTRGNPKSRPNFLILTGIPRNYT
jgi:hypothetical protein